MDQKLLLIVDDHEDNRVVFTAALAHYGYRTLSAANGAEAIALAKEFHPDLVLMDLQMPVMNGWVATRLLKEDPTTASIPIVAVTAEVHPVPRLNGAGFRALIQKPVTLVDLARAVATCMAALPQTKSWIKLADHRSGMMAGLEPLGGPFRG